MSEPETIEAPAQPETSEVVAHEEELPFRLRIKILAAERGTSQRGLAALIGVRETLLSSWATGRLCPGTRAICKIAKALKLTSLDQLIVVPGVNAPEEKR